MRRLLHAAAVSIFVSCLRPASVSAHEEEQAPTGSPEKLGRVEFPVSCSAPAQQEFTRAVALLHSFDYPEAMNTFTRVTQVDPACAMGYWGVAMSAWYPLWYPPTKESLAQGSAAVRNALQTGAKTDRERDYINAIGAFFQDYEQVDHKARALAYERAMAALHEQYPQDSEGAAFYALALQAAADPNDKTYAKQSKSGAILEQLYAAQPDHPGAAHYLIHAYDYPELAARALPAAHHYGDIAPSIPHALHMPSHTFIALGLWPESIAANLRANAAAKRLDRIQEELHTMDYLVYANLQMAQDQTAKAVVDALNDIKIGEKHTLGMDYAVAAGPARFALERRSWREAAALSPQASSFPVTNAVTYFARALGAARSGSPNQAETDVAKLAELRDRLQQAKQDYWAKQVDIQYRSALAWLQLAKGISTEALATMRSAADLDETTYKHPITPGQILPARELLADMLSTLDRPEQALVEYEASLRMAPNRFNGVYGAAHAAHAAGDESKAKAYYAQLLALCQAPDCKRVELREASRFLATN
ncbi:MAG: hypothetical protein ABI612_01240 [Betaproteobacteria bacterium]